MRVLVTGGAGFIGSHLVEALVKQEHDVTVFDDLSTGSEENLAAVQNEIRLIKANITNIDELRLAMKGVKVVFHLAASRSVVRSAEHPIEANVVNVEGTLKVMMASRDAGVKRVVFASSSSVYGDALAFMESTSRTKDSKNSRQIEEQRPWPVSHYAVSKLAAESYVLACGRIYNVVGVALRYFNVFGPRQRPDSPYAAVVPLFMEAAFRGRPLEIHGDGKQSRDFTYITNVVDANLKAAQESVPRGVFNVASGTNYSLWDLIDQLEKITGKDLKTNAIRTAPRKEDVPKTWADISKAERVIGYKPAVDFSAGLKKTWEWFISTQQTERNKA